MGSTGLESGIKISGNKPGIKSGRSLSPMRGGMSGGLSNGVMNHRNMQNPLLLGGDKLPIVFWNAENCTVNASNNVLTVPNLNTSSTETLSILSDPNRVTGDVYGGKAGIVFDPTDSISTSLILSGKTEATMFFVAEPTSTAGQIVALFQFTTIQDTNGDLSITANSGTLTAKFTGNPNTTNCTIRTKILSTVDYYIITAKMRINKTGKDAFELFINGAKQFNYTVSTYTAGTSFIDSPLYFGGNPSQTIGGNSIGSGIAFGYYLSESEQLRIENYLRWYYGRNF